MKERPIGFRPSDISTLVNRGVVAQHAEDAAFLWFLRDRAVRSPHYRLKDLERLDERVEANIDGLRTAGLIGWELAAEGLKTGLPGEIFTAAVLAFESRSTDRIDAVLEAGAADPASLRPLISALGWMRLEDAQPVLANLIQSKEAAFRAAAVGGYAAQRLDSADWLRQTLLDPDVTVRSRALKAAGELGRTDLAYTVLEFLSDPDRTSRFYAAWSAARLGLRQRKILDTLRGISESAGPHAVAAIQMALRCLNVDEARTWLTRMANSKLLRLAVMGMGAVGDPALVTELIGYMQLAPVARIAGEALAMITGIDLKYLDLDRPQPEELESQPNDDLTDPNIAIDGDEDLPWPAPELIRKWWDAHHYEYQFGVRYLGGKPITPANLIDTLRRGYQNQRAAAALELALQHPSEVAFETRARADRQLARMAQWSS